AYVLCRAVNPLLVNEVQVTQGRLLVRVRLEQDTFGHELQGGSDSVVARNADVARPVPCEFMLAQLEQADIRTGALLGVEAGLDLRNRLHDREVQSQYACSPPDFFDRRPGRVVLQSVENRIRRFGLRRQFRISIKSEVREILACAVRLGLLDRGNAGSILQT